LTERPIVRKTGACSGYPLQIECTGDGGIFGDAASCVATPAGDSMCTGTDPPHYYVCALTALPAPYVSKVSGNVVDTYCCP